MSSQPPLLSIASDHGGFALKQAVVVWLNQLGYLVADLGPARLDLADDYPPAAAAVARAVTANPATRGILLCRSGQGVAIVANKFPGIRAATAWNEATARAAREDDDVNVLCLPADYLTEASAKRLVRSWLSARLKPEESYRRRLQEIRVIEQAVGTPKGRL